MHVVRYFYLTNRYVPRILFPESCILLLKQNDTEVVKIIYLKPRRENEVSTPSNAQLNHGNVCDE